MSCREDLVARDVHIIENIADHVIDVTPVAQIMKVLGDVATQVIVHRQHAVPVPLDLTQSWLIQVHNGVRLNGASKKLV